MTSHLLTSAMIIRNLNCARKLLLFVSNCTCPCRKKSVWFILVLIILNIGLTSLNLAKISRYLVQAVADFERRDIKKISSCFGLVAVSVLVGGTGRLTVTYEWNSTGEINRKNSVKNRFPFIFFRNLHINFYDMMMIMMMMIYLLTAVGFPPGGSSTVHINTQFIERHKTNNI
jgi:hypothetical protein